MKSPLASRHKLLGAVLGVVMVLTGVSVARASVNSVSRTITNGPTTNGQASLLFVGDSLTVGTSYFGKMQEKIAGLRTWSAVTVDAKTGRKASMAIRILDQKISTNTTAIVIALGTNDMISRRETWYPAWVINQVMTRTRDIPVLWVNVKFSPTGRGDWRQRATRFNRSLEQAKLEWPNLYTADWNTFFKPNQGSRFVADGVHLTVKGYNSRTSYLLKQIAQFGDSIVMATSTTTTSSTTTTTSPSTTTTTVPGADTSTTTSPTTSSP